MLFAWLDVALVVVLRLRSCSGPHPPGAVCLSVSVLCSHVPPLMPPTRSRGRGSTNNRLIPTPPFSPRGGGCVKSVLYRTLSVRDLYFIFAYIGLNPYYIAAYIRTISDFLAFLKPLSNCNTNALCPNHAQIWSLICIQGCASPMSVVEENTVQVTPSRAVHVV